MSKRFLRSAFNYDVKEASDAASVAIVGPSLTVQSMAEDADLNVIMHRFGITGRFPDNPRVPVYADFSEVTDFRSALAAVEAARAAFMEYPASLRARFDNDPQRLLEFVSDGRNMAEAQALGLLKPVEPPASAPAASPAASPAAPAA